MAAGGRASSRSCRIPRHSWRECPGLLGGSVHDLVFGWIEGGPTAGCRTTCESVHSSTPEQRVRHLGRASKSAALLRDLRPSPGGPARGGPEINSTLLASP